MDRETQTRWAFQQLLSGEEIDHAKHLDYVRAAGCPFGGHRLSGLIHKMRQEGIPVETRIDAHHQARYSLAPALRDGAKYKRIKEIAVKLGWL